MTEPMPPATDPFPYTEEELAAERKDHGKCDARCVSARWLATLDAERTARAAAEAANELLNKHLDMVQATNADLRAVVSKLPKTADGVPMYLGSLFHYNHENHDTAHPYWETIGAGVIGMARDWIDHETYVDDIHYRDENGTEDEISPSRCYSTRAAAEAARRAPDAAERGGG